MIKKGKRQMAYTLDPGFIAWCDYWDALHKWASQCPPRWRLIKYIKWLRSEPKYEKEN